MIKVSPSVLAADPLRLGEEAQRMVDAGCDWLHVDIMDGCFVPNLSYGPSLVKALRGRFSIPLDVHLMIAHPERYVETFIAAGADWLTIHAEAAADLPALLREIRRLGAHPSVSLKPATASVAAPGMATLMVPLLKLVASGFPQIRPPSKPCSTSSTLKPSPATARVSPFTKPSTARSNATLAISSPSMRPRRPRCCASST